jgi:L-lactate dehydrogenase complex protein LldF
MANKELAYRVRSGLDDKEAAAGRERALGFIRGGMRKMVPQYPELSNRLHSIKSNAIANLELLVQQATDVLNNKGVKVFRAKTSEEALRYVSEIVGQGLVVKSKSNAAKEIDLVQMLQEQGAKVVETDLGDRIVQLAGSHASHSLAPAIHMTVNRVAEIFSKDLGQSFPADEEVLVEAARVSLRNYLLTADVGLSGANAIAADTGSIIVMENEGNIRAVTSLPRVHIAIAGIEKIVPTLEDALTVVRAASVFGVGQDFGTYASVITGPSRTFDLDGDEFLAGLGPEEVHLVLLEHGRWEAKAQGFDETLYCINCGSCLNFCPIYREVGEQYGDKYLGGRGIITAAVQKGLAAAEVSGLSLCLNCKNCTEACPSQIGTPEMINRLRVQSVSQNGMSPLWNTAFKVMSKQARLQWYANLGSKFQSLAFSREGDGQKTRLPIVGLPYRRLLPTLSAKPFYDLWPVVVTPEVSKKLWQGEDNGSKGQPDKENQTKYSRLSKPAENRRVAFFTGCMINYSFTHIGDAVLTVLGKRGVTVDIPQGQGCCGLPIYINGDLEKAREAAKTNIESLLQSPAEKIIVACATCGSHLSHSMINLFAEGDPWRAKAELVASKVEDIAHYLTKSTSEAERSELLSQSNRPISLTLTYHDPCHLNRGQGVKQAPRDILRGIEGIEFIEMADADTCCGFGGTCSFKQYEISERVRKRKLNAIQETKAAAVAAGCPGCLTHIQDGLQQEGLSVKAYHPIELLAMSYGWKGRE